jgi:hypothetical protein
MLIEDRLVSDGGWVDRKGVACFNLYRPPVLKRGGVPGHQVICSTLWFWSSYRLAAIVTARRSYYTKLWLAVRVI